MNQTNQHFIKVSIQDQALVCYEGSHVVMAFSVSTALKGAGQAMGSEQTPLGRHIIRAKIGGSEPSHAVFVGRRPTGEVYSQQLAEQFPNRDWVLSRILWLSGTELGQNRLGNVDSQRRYIYIHGTPDTEPMGEPKSHGCIRMRNNEVIKLFDWVNPYTFIDIQVEPLQDFRDWINTDTSNTNDSKTNNLINSNSKEVL